MTAMSEPAADHDALPTLVCPRCGKPLPPLTLVCRECGEPVVNAKLLRWEPCWERNHTEDILLATAAFLIANLVLFSLLGWSNFLSLEATTSRLIVLGIPFAAVVWKWYRLMRQIGPDYGLLWKTYWMVQIQVFLWLVGLLLVTVIVIMALSFGYWLLFHQR